MNKNEASNILAELEENAKERYVRDVEWTYLFECLNDDEQEEWKKAYKKAYGQNFKI